MIVGHGIDLQELAAIEKALAKQSGFAERVLTERELRRFSELKGRRQIEYLAGRWAAKEAFSKALGTGIGRLTCRDIEVLSDEKGAPYLASPEMPHKVWVSISHSGNFAQASVIVEERDESK